MLVAGRRLRACALQQATPRFQQRVATLQPSSLRLHISKPASRHCSILIVNFEFLPTVASMRDARTRLRHCFVAASAMRAHRASRPLSSAGSDAALPFFRGSLWKPA